MRETLRAASKMVDAFDQIVCDTLGPAGFADVHSSESVVPTVDFINARNRLTTELREIFFTKCGLLNTPRLLSFCHTYDYTYCDIESIGPKARFSIKTPGYKLLVTNK